ncbi:MAG TPA: alkaline phosphatase family protein [Cytophagaceae bacterium]|jgi:predicted AlkP superfamily phosphohydrolase/phosphomutase/tetratricopeptide (TPR) repeat protein|nr:alkaline phosphatase family protein [Cytophagaceae bacterium]
MNKKKVILIGLDSADWSVIRPLMELGMMPGFKKLVEGGVSGNIETLSPSFSPMLWTSIATGKTADKHGILGFVEPESDGTGIRPVSSTSRKCRAIWNILHNQGYKTNVVGWWPSHPAEPINGVMVSNQFQKAVNLLEEAWPVKENAVSGIAPEKLAGLRVHPEQILADVVKVFVPEWESIDQEKDTRLQVIQALTAEAFTLRNTGLWLMDQTEWDFMAIYFNELDQFSHHFMKFHPPQMNGIPDDLFKTYYNVITAAYTLFDSIVYDFLEKAGNDATVVLLSDHGFHSGEKRIKSIPQFDAGIALEHNPYGVLCMKGPNINKNKTVVQATLLDITPTILATLGIPLGKDMDGKVLSDIFEIPKEIKYIESWETVEGDFGEHDKSVRKDTFSEHEAMRQLIELGYIEKMEDSLEEQLLKVSNETKYNLSAVLAGNGKTSAAVELLEKLYEEDMVDIRYNLDLIRLHAALGNAERARAILTNFKKFDISRLPNFDYLEGKIFLSEGKKEEALKCFEKALVASPQYKDLLLDLGFLYNRLKKYEEAERTFQKLISLDATIPEAHHGLAILYNRTARYDEAVDCALSVIKLRKDYAPAHYHLGEAFYRLEEYEVAAQALEICLKLNPGISRARNLLLNIYRTFLPDAEKFAQHDSIFQKTRKGEIVIVSGLPRSGTSMMMQLLHAGGMEVLTDNLVMPDESNPKGYFEYAPVKNSRKDNSWMEQATGKAVKVIAQLLPALKMKHSLKIIFMERDIKEIVISQNKMIASKNGSSTTKTVDFDIRLMNTFEQQLKEVKEWAENRNNVEIIYVDYKSLIENTEEEIRTLNNFLGWQLQEENMQHIVLPELYRVRS